MIEDFTDQYGLPAWVVEDEAVEIDAVKKVHKFKASVDRATSGSKNKAYQPVPGEYFIPDVFSRRSDGSIQTFSEWAKGLKTVE